MNTTKSKFLLNGFIAILAVVTLGIVSSLNPRSGRLFAEGPEPYSITFNTTTNKIGTEPFKVGQFYSGTGEARTGLNNAVGFDYGDFANPTNIWQTIKAGGYFTNTNPIMGMTGISIEKDSTSANLGVYWSADKTFNESRYQEFGTSTPANVSTNFDDYLPNYIKVIALGENDSSITSAKIEFSCSNQYPLNAGDNYYLGSYPQTKVMDATLISTLNTAGGTLPSSANSQTWTSYNYYISNSNTTNFMWYKDVTNGSDKYRGVYFTSYRPYFTTSESSASYSYQDDNGYNTSTSYWFKYEPIKWDVLSVDETDGPLVVADMILDSQEYYHPTSNRTIGETTIYPNNYKESNIRTWLNSDFYNQAFSSSEQSSINTSTVDNSAASTGTSPNSYACANTSDKMFLLSYQDVTNASYGFNSDASRIRQATDYAKAMGSYTSSGNSDWWLRSPYGGHYNYGAQRVRSDGTTNYGNVPFTAEGVLPSFRINL